MSPKKKYEILERKEKRRGQDHKNNCAGAGERTLGLGALDCSSRGPGMHAVDIHTCRQIHLKEFLKNNYTNSKYCYSREKGAQISQSLV